MSLVDAGAGYIRGRRRSGRVGNSNLVISSIGGTGGEGSVVSLGKTEIEPRRSRQP